MKAFPLLEKTNQINTVVLQQSHEIAKSVHRMRGNADPLVVVIRKAAACGRKEK